MVTYDIIVSKVMKLNVIKLKVDDYIWQRHHNYVTKSEFYLIYNFHKYIFLPPIFALISQNSKEKNRMELSCKN